MQQQPRKHREKHDERAHIEASRQRVLHRRGKGCGKALRFCAFVRICSMRHRRQRAADEQPRTERRGDMDKIQRRTRAAGRKHARAAHAEQKTRPRVVAEGEQPLALVSRQHTVFHKLGSCPCADRVAAAEAQRQRGRARTRKTEQRPHQRRQKRREQLRRAAGDEQRREHEKRKQRRDKRLRAEQHRVPRRLCADLRQQQQCGKAAQHRQKRQTVSYFHAIT